MTDKMLAAGQSVAAYGTEVVGATAAFGPESIEGYYDEVFAIPPLIEAVQTHAGSVDGIVVGCFDDTGVDAVRTITDVPVIGICQAGMQAAMVLSGSFTVITTLGRSVPALEHLALKYGYERACRKVRACEIPVLDLENNDAAARTQIEREIEIALDQDGAESIVLGCAGMVDLTKSLTEQFSVPVIDGVTVAVKAVESLSGIGLRTSRRGGYAPPRAKAYAGESARFAPTD